MAAQEELITHEPNVVVNARQEGIVGKYMIYMCDADIFSAYNSFIQKTPDLPRHSLRIYICSNISSANDIAPGLGSAATKRPTTEDLTNKWATWFTYKVGALIRLHLSRQDSIIFYDTINITRND